MLRAELEVRVRRLDELARGLFQEMALWRGTDSPALFVEQEAYRIAVGDALTDVEEARVVLLRVLQQLDAEREANGTPRTRYW